MAVSVKDVAAHAGLSVGTVSNVLNRPDKVSEDTRGRVLAAIDGGVPEAQSRILARDTALALMKADPRVLQTPAPDVVVYELGAHAINLGIRCYVKSADWFGTKVTLLEQLKRIHQQTVQTTDGKTLTGLTEMTPAQKSLFAALELALPTPENITKPVL